MFDTPESMAACFVNVDPQYLVPATVGLMSMAELARLRVYPKQCYSNAWKAARTYQCEVVLGVVNVTGIPLEHAWICRDGEHLDPTLQWVHGSITGSYLAIYRISCADYPAMLQAMKISAPIDFYALRRFAGTRHLFDYKNPMLEQLARLNGRG